MYPEIDLTSPPARSSRAAPPTRDPSSRPDALSGARAEFREFLAAETVRHALQRPGPLPPLVHERARAFARAHRAAGTPVERMVVELKQLIEGSGVDAAHTHSGSAHAEQLFRWSLGAYFSEG